MGVGLNLSNGLIYTSHNREGPKPNDETTIRGRKSIHWFAHNVLSWGSYGIIDEHVCA